MNHTTTDITDPKLTRGIDVDPVTQAPVYLVLSEDEIAKGFVRPVRDSYIHEECGTVTRFSRDIAETYAREPKFYGATYCCYCRKHRPVSEFHWTADHEKVGS